jgi:radical SAM superfamily enzyme YgiQ (UPF0313 family)
MYMKTKGRRYSGYSKHWHQRFSREYAIVDQSYVIRFWENYITELNDRANWPGILEVEAEEEVDEDEKDSHFSR